jgi:transposase
LISRSSVFRLRGIDAAGSVVIRRQLKRRYVLAFFQKLSPCLVGIEACATSHHWSRELHLGHTVRLIPPACVRPYVKRQNNDCTDAETICEAVDRTCDLCRQRRLRPGDAAQSGRERRRKSASRDRPRVCRSARSSTAHFESTNLGVRPQDTAVASLD